MRSKPSPPAAPRAPIKPERVYHETFRASVSLGHSSLADVLKQIEEIGNRVYDETRRCDGAPPYDQIEGYVLCAHSYDDCDEVGFRWTQSITVTRTDDQMTKALKEYQRDLMGYANVKLPIYQTKMREYEAALAAWTNAREQAAETREREQLARFIAKYGVPHV